ncbi:porin, partial [Vibrio parahaemolyticus]|nr:porin [Vibrio parahaemolyticus]
AGYALGEKDSNEEVLEVFVGKSFNDLSLHAGVLTANNDINVTKEKKLVLNGVEQTVSHTERTDNENLSFEVTGEYALGEHTLGATYYYNENEDKNANSTVDSHGISLAGMFAVAPKTTLYSGYELVMSSSDVAGTVDADDSRFYAGVEYKFSKWARVFVEGAYVFEETKLDNSKVDSKTDFGVGARFYW